MGRLQDVDRTESDAEHSERREEKRREERGEERERERRRGGILSNLSLDLPPPPPPFPSRPALDALLWPMTPPPPQTLRVKQYPQGRAWLTEPIKGDTTAGIGSAALL